MTKYLKLALPALAIGCVVLMWPEQEDFNGKEMSEQINITASDSYIDNNEAILDHDTPAANNMQETKLNSPITIHEVLVFADTQDYEANSRYGKLPSHMSDIAIERFSIDSNKQLVVSESIKNIFEYFLMASHIEGKEQAIARIKEYIELSLTGDAAAQAMSIADNYLLYKENLNTDRFSMSTDFSQEENLTMLKSALDDKKQTRRQYLGDTVSQALFGHEESYDDFSFQRLTINADSSLSVNEKDRLIAKAEQQLPPKMAANMRYKREERTLNSRVNELKNQTGQDEKIYQLRADFYGEHVAKRLAYLESNTPEWQSRVNEFYRVQNEILASSTLSNEEKRQAIKEAKQNTFTHKEQIKLAVQSIRGV